MFWGAWAACLPAIQRSTDASDSGLGLALLAVALGALPAMLGAGALADALGPRIVPLALVAFGLATMFPALARSVPALFLLLLVIGVTTGLLDVAINADASRLESAFRVRVMDGLHAGFSIGVLIGGAGAGLLRKAGAEPSWILSGIGVLIVVTAALNRDSGQARSDAPRPRRVRPGKGLLIVGAVLALAFVVESGLEQWSALFLERTLDSSPAISGLGPGLFAASMAASRLAAQRFAHAAASSRMILAGAAAAVGVAVSATAQHAAVALLGLVIAGGGVGLAAPTLFGVAGRIGGEGGRGAAVSTVAILGYLGFLAGPPLMGAVAGATSLRGGFVFLGGAALLVAFCAPTLRRARESPG